MSRLVCMYPQLFNNNTGFGENKMFTARIELADVPESKSREVYEGLHTKLNASGFKRTIKSSDNITYKLPHATYVYRGSLTTKSDVLDLACKIANNTGYGARVIVFEYESASWRNLEKVSTAEALLNM